jgi:hypothetical protein
MNARQRTRILGFAAASIALGAVAVVVTGVALPVRIDDAAAVADARTIRPATAEADGEAGRNRPPLQALLRLAKRDLRPPLYDPPPPPEPQPRTDPPTPLTVQLVGTILEPGHAMAILQQPDGSTEICAAGESIDHAGRPLTVTEVGARSAVVTWSGRSQTLELPEDSDAEGGRP